ncbi:hypothetical protein OC844_004784 [Tilletia horrida]|nr:hypothetical protein OC844_004784 [Tilletia horrida]
MDRRMWNFDSPDITALPPIYVCLDCQNEQLIVTTLIQVQTMIFFGAIIALFAFMTTTLFLFANKRMLRSRIFWGSVGALTVNLIAVCLFLVELMPGTTMSLRARSYITITCLRRVFTLITAWSWSLVLLGKFFAFYPPSIRQRKHRILLGVLIVLKARIILDVVSIGILYGGIGLGKDFTFPSTALYFFSVCLDLADNFIVTTVLLRTSLAFYRKAQLRLSTNGRKIRLLVESIGMTFICAIPPQFIYAVGLIVYMVKPELIEPSAQKWVALWQSTSLGIFGVLSTVYSSIGNVPAIKHDRAGGEGWLWSRSRRRTQTQEAQVGAGADANTPDFSPRVETVPYLLDEQEVERQGGSGSALAPSGAGAAAAGPLASAGDTEPTESLLSIFFVNNEVPSSSDPPDSPSSFNSNRTVGAGGEREKMQPQPQPFELIQRRRRWLQLGPALRDDESKDMEADVKASR